MYKVKTKKAIIALDVKTSDEVSKPVYAGASNNIAQLIEESYGPQGHIIGENFSVDELIFALDFLGVEYKVLDSQGVKLLDEYEPLKPGQVS